MNKIPAIFFALAVSLQAQTKTALQQQVVTLQKQFPAKDHRWTNAEHQKAANTRHAIIVKQKQMDDLDKVSAKAQFLKEHPEYKGK